jgi:hypothetical protein
MISLPNQLRTHWRIRLFLPLALFFTLTVLSAPAAFASGHWECNYYNQCVWVDDDPQPEYYATLTSEPNWCTYPPGDRVWVHSTLVNNQLVANAWYVIPGNDGVSTGPTGSGWSGDWYVSSGCYIFLVP